MFSLSKLKKEVDLQAISLVISLANNRKRILMEIFKLEVCEKEILFIVPNHLKFGNHSTKRIELKWICTINLKRFRFMNG